MSKITKLLPIALALAIGAVAGMPAQAQDYPTRPVQVIVPFAGGSASDVITRIMLHKMSESLGQNFIVDNRPGAGGNTGTAAATKATPDGYTLLMSTSGPLAANKTLFKTLGYDPEKDLAPISLFAVLPNVVVVNSKLPPKTLSQLFGGVPSGAGSAQTYQSAVGPLRPRRLAANQGCWSEVCPPTRSTSSFSPRACAACSTRSKSASAPKAASIAQWSETS